MDTIFLHGLKVDAVIGIWDWERRIRQSVVIDLDMAADIRRAAETDSVVIRWPVSSLPVELQSTGGLAPEGNWGAAPGLPPWVEGGYNYVTNLITDGERYYRLWLGAQGRTN